MSLKKDRGSNLVLGWRSLQRNYFLGLRTQARFFMAVLMGSDSIGNLQKM